MIDEIDWDLVFHPELQGGADEVHEPWNDEDAWNEMLREEFGDE